MIKNLFVPEHIRGYYLLGKRVIGFDIGKASVKATVVYLKGKERTIERSFEVPIAAPHKSEEYQEHTSQAIKQILDQAGSYDAICTSISSSQVIFKELKLPFIGYDKIKMVIQFEVEPLLPFASQDAVIDFIITKELPEEKSSEVLVAAIHNQYIAQHLALFETAQVQPELITVDLIALYGLFKQIPAYTSLSGGTVLLEIEPYNTRMLYLHDGQLRYMRTLNKGLIEQAKNIAQLLKISQEEALEQLIRFGFETSDHKEDYLQTLRTTFAQFFNEITFTLQSFVSQARPAQSINTILIFGTSAVIKGLPQLVSELTATRCEVLNLTSLLSEASLGIKAKNAIPPATVVSLATALPLPVTNKFNVRQKEFALSDLSILNKQLMIAASLGLFVLLALVGNTLWQISSLRYEAYTSEQEVIVALKERFKKIPEETANLEEITEDAQRELKEEEKLWFAFSGAGRSKFLKYLLELTTNIDQEGLGLVIEKLTISDGVMNLKAQVKGIEELKTLERDLRQSKLFSSVEPQNDPNFTQTGMVIRLKPEQGT